MTSSVATNEPPYFVLMVVYCAYVTRLLKNERQPIPDVPAIYFVEPTSDNIRRISEVRACLLAQANTNLQEVDTLHLGHQGER